MSSGAQSAIVVGTKVSLPRIARVVARPRVRQQLVAVDAHPLRWLHGGPGAGKTVAVAELVQGHKPTPMWLQVDAGDADVAVFFANIAAAASRAWPRRRFSLPKLHPEQQIGGIGPYARRFFAAIVGKTTGATLVLDDYHHIPEQSAVHEAVLAAAEALGEGGRVIVASRKAPPPAFARARMSGTVAVIPPESLRFDRDEVDALVAERELAISDAERDAIHRLTDGWAAGLALVLASGRLDEHAAADLQRETLFGYFMTEVLRGLEEETVQVLLRTSFIRSVDVALAHKLSGVDDAGERLSALQRRALFVMRDADSGTRFRCHDLFRDFLRDECRRRMSADELRALVVQTAKALLHAGDTEQGADLLVEAEAWDELVQMVLGGAAMVVFAGRFTSLARWLDAMPNDVVESSPWLGYWRGLALLLSEPDRSRQVLEPVVEAFAEAADDLGYCLAYSALATAVLAARHDMRHYDRLIETLFKRIEAGWSFPFDHAEAHVASAITIALAFRAPDHPDLERWRERARELEPLLPTPELRAIALLRIGLSSLWSGDFVLAAKCVETMAELCPEGEEPSPFHTGATRSVEQYLRLYTDPAACRDLRDRGLADAEHFGLTLWTPTLNLHDAAASLSLGKLDDARATLDALASEIHTCTRVERGYYGELRAWQALIEGDWDQALHHGEDAMRIGEAYGARLPVLSSQYAIALAKHGLGARDEARAMFRELMERSTSIRYLTFQTGMALAEVELADGDEAAALEALRPALELGRTIGCNNYFHWRSQAVVDLLCLALREGIEVAFVQELVRIHRITTEVPPAIADVWPFPLRIRTLGAPLVTGDAAAGVVPEGPLRGLRLRMLAELVAAPEDGVPLRRLADDLWPDADGDRAMQSLHTTLHRLRKALGCEAAVVVDGGFAKLDRRLCTVDAWRVMATAKARDASPEAIASARRLYGGPFMEGADLEATALGYREKLRDAKARLDAR